MTTDKQVLHDKINTFFEESYFDVHSIGTKLSFTETQLVKLMTKISVGLVTVWVSSIELKTLLKSYKFTKGI
jgi:hypothetical protein